MRRKIELGTVIFFIVAAVIVACIATYMYMSHMVERTIGKNEMYGELAQVYQVVNNRYVGEFDEDKAMDSLLSGFIEGVDEYGVYFDKESYLEYQEGLNGKNSGIGVDLKYVAALGQLKVTRVRSGSPAEKAGIKPGDIISAIDGVDLASISYSEATTRLQPNLGTEIKLKIFRGSESINISVTTQEYIEKTVTGRVMTNNTGYVAITSFNTETSKDFIATVEALKKKKVTKFIFDVRNNPGGSLTAVTEVLDYILPEGVLCSTVDKANHKVPYESDAACLTGEIVVLINGDTYSGGELFAAAIRDFNYGTLVGTTTYGKGMAQEIIPLDDGSALYLSTNLYNPPCGVNYDGIGVSPSPDCEIKLTAAQEDRFYELTFDEDPQLQKAMTILNG